MLDLRKAHTAGTSKSTRSRENAGGKKRKINAKTTIIILIVIVVGLSFGYAKALRDVNNLRDPEARQELDRAEVLQVVEQVRRHMLLPEEELPQVATVIDAEALRGEQPFYKDVQNGDKVLIYLERRQAVVYSPERDIIVNVGSVVLDQPIQEVTAPEPEEESVPISPPVADSEVESNAGDAQENDLNDIENGADSNEPGA